MANNRQPYATNCAMMALARTEKMTTGQMHQSLVKLRQDGTQQIDNAKNLEHDNKILDVLNKRNYSEINVGKGTTNWADVRNALAEKHKTDSTSSPSRYFAMSYPIKKDGTVSDKGHAVSLNVTGKGRGVTVFGNNADKNASKIGAKPNWVDKRQVTIGSDSKPKQQKLANVGHRAYQARLESGVEKSGDSYTKRDSGEQFHVRIFQKKA